MSHASPAGPVLAIRSSIIPDLSRLAPRLRQADVAEIKASSGLSPQDALLRAYVVSSECYTVLSDGEPIALFGLVPDGKRAAIWLLGSDAMLRHKRELLMLPARWLKHWHEKYPVLYNYVDARNTAHVRWLKWMGCQFIAEHPQHGAEKRPFKEFIHV